MADIKITYDPHQMRRVQKLLSAVPNGMPKVMSRGINNTTKSARTKIVRDLSRITKIQQKTIRNAIRFYKASYRRWSALLRISGRGISLIRLKARQIKAGVSYVDPTAASRTTLPHAFVATMPSGRKGVFLRLSKSRLPIEKQYAPALSQIYTDSPGVVSRIQAETGKDLTKNIMTQVRLVLQKARGS